MRPLRASGNSDGLGVSCAGNGAVAAPGEAAEAGCASGAKGLEYQSPLVQSRGTLRDTLRIRRPCACWQGRDSGVRPRAFAAWLPLREARLRPGGERGGGGAAAGARSAVLCAVICAKCPGAGTAVLPVEDREGARRWHLPALPHVEGSGAWCPTQTRCWPTCKARTRPTARCFKIREDPRVVPGVGAFIRKHSIGRAPPAPERACRPDVPHRPEARPPERGRPIRRARQAPPSGQTRCGGAWQVSGRSDIGFEQMVDLDLDYMHSRGIAKDLDLVVRTLGAMRSGKGAS